MLAASDDQVRGFVWLSVSRVSLLYLIYAQATVSELDQFLLPLQDVEFSATSLTCCLPAHYHVPLLKTGPTKDTSCQGRGMGIEEI